MTSDVVREKLICFSEKSFLLNAINQLTFYLFYPTLLALSLLVLAVL